MISLAPNKTVDENRQGEAFPEIAEKAHDGPLFYIESYGCAMNFSDSEIVASILGEAGYAATREMEKSDLILINTCSIREKAEDTVRKRLKIFNQMKRKRPGVLIGVLGCMAERLKTKFLEQEKLVDIVVGPDAYRDLPKLIHTATDGEKGINVHLSREETYADISPIRLDSNGISAFISIMRGCDNMCSFCVVPFTRGRERSRDTFSIIAEATELLNQGYREVTLLGQNVDSYKWTNPETDETINFAQLLELVAKVAPSMRVRFSTSHPKDITDEVLHTIAKYHNICKHIHLPSQSGSSRVLKLMNRTYTREWYLERVESIRRIVPAATISSDMITGFCTETEEDHKETLSLIELSDYSLSYMYYYSERPGTMAARKFEDDIPLAVKKRRLAEVIEVQHQVQAALNQKDLDQTFEVLIDGDSKRSDQEWRGRSSQNKVIIFPKVDGTKAGDYVQVKVVSVGTATLRGEQVIIAPAAL
ncbi:MAG: tRNA (N6-isopentenyl adenosine(37)-C2)-methylthiotransferase MiaB [Saprospiraceae bacterium]